MDAVKYGGWLEEILGMMTRVIEIADNEEDHILAAKCDDIRCMVTDRLELADTRPAL